MLKTLELSSFAIVDALKIDLSPGLNVLTGETGAGKSILVDALTLLTGARADTSTIRSGAESALVQGIFSASDSDSPASAARRIASAGRSTARLDGELVTVTELAERMGKLVAIHGQHASQTLMSSTEQRKLLDRLLDKKTQQILSGYRTAYADYQTVTKDLERLREQVRERARRLDILEFQIEEIDAAGLKPDELAQLQEELENLRHAERITLGAGTALNLLSEAEVNASSLVAQAAKGLESAARYSKPLASLAAELAETLASLQAISSELSAFLDGFDADPASLDELEARFIKVEDLKRKYGESIDAILSYRAEAATELASLLNADANMSELEAKREDLEAYLHEQADLLSNARRRISTQVSQGVSQELKPLGMVNAVFEVEITPTDTLGAFGRDSIAFLFSANLGEAAAPLANVASGGELSRVMLALNVVTGSELPVLVFDEVDAGIGGKTARAVGQLLKRLARDHQVLVVTHLPQVAAFADAQFYVEKQASGERTVTRVNRLEPHEREYELARMLSGSTSDAALANARELLSEAQDR